MILLINMYLNYKIELKTRIQVKLELTREKLINSIKSIRFYEFTKFVI